jgi:Uma2 family endonuclease
MPATATLPDTSIRPVTKTVPTTAELFTMPDDGIDRELIRGELKEKPMTKRNRYHSHVTTRVAKLLDNWLDLQPAPRGQVLTGEAGVRLERDPDTTVGIDVAYVSAESLEQTPVDLPWVEGPPVLAVEVLSPSDTQKDMVEKVRDYLRTGVAVVWVIDPDFQLVHVHQRGVPAETFNVNQELPPHLALPGLRVRVADLFRV